MMSEVVWVLFGIFLIEAAYFSFWLIFGICLIPWERERKRLELEGHVMFQWEKIKNHPWTREEVEEKCKSIKNWDDTRDVIDEVLLAAGREKCSRITVGKHPYYSIKHVLH